MCVCLVVCLFVPLFICSFVFFIHITFIFIYIECVCVCRVSVGVCAAVLSLRVFPLFAFELISKQDNYKRNMHANLSALICLRVNSLIGFPNVPTLRDASKVARLVTLEIGKFNSDMTLSWSSVQSGGVGAGSRACCRLGTRHRARYFQVGNMGKV